MRRPVLLAALAVCFVDVAHAIDPNRAMSQYVRDRWGQEQGFPGGPVYAFAQTADGYLWIGSEAGLLRFDGLKFQAVAEDFGPENLARVLGLLPDKEGNLWVRTHTPRLLRYRDGIFHRGSTGGPAGGPTSDGYVNFSAMSRTNQGNLLASVSEQGVVTNRDGKLHMLAAYSGMPRSPVFSIAQTSDGDIWAGTRDAGLFRLRGGKAYPISEGLPDPKINCLLAGKDGELWVGTDKGVVRWNGVELTPVETGGPARRLQALAMVRDRDQNLWVGTDSRGLLRINRRGVSALSSAQSQAVTAVFEDREGNVWFGSANGIERLRDSAFVTYSPSEHLPTNGAIPVFSDSENRTWFPPAEGGLWWLKDGEHGRVTGAGLDTGLDKDLIYSIAGTAGELWLGRRRGGLTQLRAGSGPFFARTYTQADGLPQNSVYSVYRSRDGAVWAGTLSGGVSRFRNGRFTTYTTVNGLASNTVASILEDSEGTMWFATPVGLSAFSKGRWQTYTGGLPSANVNCILEDSGGVLWAGTAAGLAFRSGQQFKAPADAPAALREQVFGMAEDRHGWLWVATSHHVLRVKRDSLLQGTPVEGEMREFGLADGLRSVEGVKRHQSVVTDSLGRIWFSMNGGISVVDPVRLISSSAPAVVHIQTVAADGSAASLRTPVQIPGGSQRITFGYAGLSLSVPERVRFRYMLEGFDRGWSEPVAAREAIYTNLDPGTYRFRVIASNPDGVWNSSEAAVALKIAPLFWQIWWFRLSCVLTVAFAVAAVYRFRLHQMTRHLNFRFEERLAERTRIAQELHDTLLQGFLSASMQLHVAVDRLPEDSPVKPPLGRVLQLMGQVIEEGRNAVRGLRSTTNGSDDLGRAFSRIPEELCMDGQIDFRVIVEGQTRALHPVLRDEVYRIGREALVNAFRHSRAKNIEMELEYAARRFRFLVRDNGCGIAPEVLEAGRDGHWGLSGMRERADRIGGRLQVWSSPVAGTEVELSVPGHVAFQPLPSNRKLAWAARLYPQRKNGESK